MNWKIALALSAVVSLAMGQALLGCGSGDDCSFATSHAAECTPVTPSTTSTTGGMMEEACSGAFLCRSLCINQFTCTQINGNDPAYTKCLTDCQGK